MTPILTRLAVFAPLVLIVAPVQAAMPTVTPHRAIYDLELDRTRESGGSADIKGRLVFEATGSACEGFTVNTRFVTQVVSGRGSLVNDLRSTTWEAGDGSSYRFITKNYLNKKLADETDGTATRGDDAITVELRAPEESTFELDADTLFPTQHMRNILEAAETGEMILTTDVFDGSDTGRKTFLTTTVIGSRRAPAGAEGENMVGGEVLSTLASWPVTIGYFDKNGDEPDTPSYEFSYDVFENGVSRRIVLNYGDFVLAGDLQNIEFLDVEPCDQ